METTTSIYNILHSDKDHQMLFVCDPSTCTGNSKFKMAKSRHFENRYLLFYLIKL